jgi:hypothetical protein
VIDRELQENKGTVGLHYDTSAIMSEEVFTMVSSCYSEDGMQLTDPAKPTQLTDFHVVRNINKGTYSKIFEVNK